MIAFIVPPFFRFFLSHNNKVGPSVLSSAMLCRKKEETIIFNGDSIPDSEAYADWYSIFQNYPRYKLATARMEKMDVPEEFGGLIDFLCTEKPETIVLCCGDPGIPTVDIGGIEVVAFTIKLIRLASPRSKIIGYGVAFWMNPDLRKLVDDYVRGIGEFYWGEGPESVPALDPSILAKKVHISNFDYIMASRGCVWQNCVFCLQTGMKSKYLEVSPETFVREVSHRKELGIQYQYFADMSFLSHSRTWLQTVARRVKELGIRFSIEARVKEVSSAPIVELKEAGLETVKLGVEGGTDEILRIYNKGATMSEVEESVRILKDNGIKVVVYVILGHPLLRGDDYKAGLASISNLNADYYVVNVACPYKGTILWEMCDHVKMEKMGLIKDGIEHGFTHLSHDLIAYWGLELSLVEQYMLLSGRTKKEDTNVGGRSYERRIWDGKS